MNNAIFGYTGLVGSHLLTNYKFNYLYNSKNINDSRDKEFDIIFICCIPAVKWFSNKFPDKDKEDIENIKNVFKTIKSNKVILISTIDIYNDINNKSNENTLIEYNNNHTYGKNRYLFELFIKDNFTNYNIIRLPALFGQGLKKNIIYDLLNNNNINSISKNTSFQWYNLEWLKDDINICINNNIKECNLFTEPVNTKEILNLFNYDYNNNPNNLFNYDCETIYSIFFNSNVNGYIRNKEIVFNDIKKFIIAENKKKNNNSKTISYSNSNYKLCVSNISNNSLNNIQYYNILKYYDIKYIEIAPTKFYDWDTLFNYENNNSENMKKIIKELNDFDLSIYSFQSITFTINNNIFDKDNSDLLNHCKKVIDLACMNGVKNLVFGCPRNRKIIIDDVLYNETIFINFMNELGNYINDRDLIISLENNSKQYNCNFLNTINEVGDITLKINNPKIKMMVDIGNCLMENDNFENIIKYKDIIMHIHISTLFMKPLNNVFINNNIVYYKKFIDILKQIDYDKIISLEFINNDENTELTNLNESLYNFTNLFN